METMEIIAGDSSYGDYENDYSHLGNILTDIGQGLKSAVGSLWKVISPAAPAITYRAVTGRELPPQQIYTQAPQTSPATPVTTYLMYGGLALLAGLVLFKVAKR